MAGNRVLRNIGLGSFSASRDGTVALTGYLTQVGMAFRFFMSLDPPVYLAAGLVSDNHPSFNASLPVRRSFSDLAH